jgi:magnesium transporter
MIIGYFDDEFQKAHILTSVDEVELRKALWVDLLNPTLEEEIFVEKTLQLEIPTREEMREIELSSRLYKDNDALFMTVTMVAKSDTPTPSTDAVTLILTVNRLLTVRYIEPLSFAFLISRLNKLQLKSTTPLELFIQLLDASIDRLADILEKVSHGLDEYSQTIFNQNSSENNPGKPDYRHHLQTIAKSGDLTTKVQESLITFNRLITFFVQTVSPPLDPSQHSRLIMLGKDINSLSDYVNFLSAKINFLLDATLGMVNIEQNNIIKIFSIAAVIFLPPTLVASIYGMNFHHMPELALRWGYPLAIGMMLLAGWLPYKFFKMKKWL